ncbi:hypothetical protein SAMN06297129_3087 [Pseudooceanicola antarcticus]|uniref:Uncharacterized protein n=1 Tax=Pseudooceanicola antarcticus TaxID=1247613 RepID=A0A285J8P2_9RHOB|nr:hypothetical protein [Pseudooceanicola antarcticus]PJE26905.1 hypothetical protein CVM39_16375 [Pseudooceanicola antarcticus]SNY55726.1 hypothetical protein SAMN06297129_3087 [Pseudooceanicola antarcticus]
MSNLEELQGRILAAMDRIGSGLEGLVPAPAPGESPEELKQLLEDERTANAQLEERVKALHRRQEALEAELVEARAAPAAGPREDVTRAMADMEEAVSRLRAVNTRLRENNRLLREAKGGADSDVLNESMAAELDALRADHAAAGAEAETILAALGALVDEPAPATEGEA